MLIHARGIRLNILERGSGDPVLFLHGIGGDATNWWPQIEVLASNRRVLALDLRGFGRSDHTLGRMTLGDYADDVIAVLDELSLERVDMVGMSMGGMVTQTLALRAPKRVRRLVLADTSARADGQMAANLTAAGTAAVTYGMGAVAEAFLASTFSAASISSDAPHVRSFADGFTATDPLAFQIGLLAISQLDLLGELKNVTTPALVIVGAEDALTPLAHAKAIVAGIAGSRLEVLDGAGHLSNLDQPARFTGLVGDFLGSAS